jgi:ankyrin repeat protein
MKQHVFLMFLFISFSLLGEVEDFNLLRTYCINSRENRLIDYERTDFIPKDEMIKYIRNYGVNERDNYGNTVLHAISIFGSADEVEILLTEGADIEARNIYGFTPLHSTIFDSGRGNIEVLLRNGANINTQAEDGKTPLISAATFNYDLVKRLVEQGADVNIKDKNGFTALHYAASSHSYLVNRDHYVDSVKLMVKKGADVNALSDTGITPLHLAVYKNDRLAIKLLLECGADSGIADVHGNKPLHYMFNNHNLKIIADLCKHEKTHDADKKRLEIAKTEFDFWLTKQFKGAAFYAIRSEFYTEDEILKYIYKYGVHERDINGNTVLHEAARRNDSTMIEIFISAGADIEARNNRGYTPLYLAVIDNFYNIDAKKNSIKVLLRNGANINIQAKDGKTPLCLLASRGNNNLTGFLIRHGADVNIKDKYGFTVLHYVVGNEISEAGKLLLKNKANLNVRSNYGITPLHLAVFKDDGESVEFFLKKGADSNLTDICGNKPIHYLGAGYDPGIIKILSKFDKTHIRYEKDFLVVSAVDLACLLEKQMFGAAFYFLFPHMKDDCYNQCFIF